MTNIKSAILSNPYFKASNCTDLNDIDAAISMLHELDLKYGQKSKLIAYRMELLLKRKQQLSSPKSLTGNNAQQSF